MGGPHRYPILQYPGLFQAPPPSPHLGTGVSSTPRPTSPISGKPAASEPGPHPIFAGHIPVPIPPFLFSGLRVDNPPPFPLSHPHNWREGVMGTQGLRALPHSPSTLSNPITLRQSRLDHRGRGPHNLRQSRLGHQGHLLPGLLLLDLSCCGVENRMRLNCVFPF